MGNLAVAPCRIGQLCILTPHTQTAFTTDAGWGLDVKAARLVWIRAVQVDYLRQFFSNDNQNVVRVSAGIVFRFGT